MSGIFGIQGSSDAANLTFLAMHALQHRGQQGAGVASWDGERINVERTRGGVRENLESSLMLSQLPGSSALGKTTSTRPDRAEPLVANTSMGPIALVLDGNLTNGGQIRRELERRGAIFQSSSSAEVVLHLMGLNPRANVTDSLMVALSRVQGAYSLLLLTKSGLLAARDPHGVRPLSLGDLGGHPCFASEAGAFEILGARQVREVEPGEILRSNGRDLESFVLAAVERPNRCAFEMVTIARPDSKVFGDLTFQARMEMGAQMAREIPADADAVVALPDTGLFAALGYSRESGLPFEAAVLRHGDGYATSPTTEQRAQGLFRMKTDVSIIKPLIREMRLALIGEAILDGTRTSILVKMFRDAGVKEVHVRISCPPTRFRCSYGVDMPLQEDLIASNHDLSGVARILGVDSLGYLSLEGLLQSLSGDPSSYCTACWSGDFPVEGSVQEELFPIRPDHEVDFFPVRLDTDD